MTGWRVRELKHRHEDGWTRLAGAAEPPGDRRILARVGDDRIVARTVADERRVERIDAEGRSRWAHTCAGSPQEAYTSGDCLLVTTNSLDYHAWGFLGPALLLDLDRGTPVAELRGDRGAALAGGRFVIGLEGYGGQIYTLLNLRDAPFTAIAAAHLPVPELTEPQIKIGNVSKVFEKSHLITLSFDVGRPSQRSRIKIRTDQPPFGSDESPDERLDGQVRSLNDALKPLEQIHPVDVDAHAVREHVLPSFSASVARGR